MATRGWLLTGSDHITDQLLSHVSHHVISESRERFATGHLGLSITEYGHIEEESQYPAKRNIAVSTIDQFYASTSGVNQVLICAPHRNLCTYRTNHGMFIG